MNQYKDFINSWFNTDQTGSLQLSYNRLSSHFNKQFINALLISAGINILSNKKVWKFVSDVLMLLYIYYLFYYFFVFILKILNSIFNILVPYKSLSFKEYQHLIEGAFSTPITEIATQHSVKISPAIVTSQIGFVLEEIQTHKSIIFYGTSATIGRSTDCDINISTFNNSEFVSRKHCRIYYGQDSGNWYIEDLKSTNGTYVNYKKIFSPTILNDGDSIKLGKLEFLFKRKG